MAEVAELTKTENWDAGTWYNVACVYAVAGGKIAGKRQEYSDRAMELLTKAVAAGWSDAAHTAGDPDLEPLRARLDFQNLLASLQPNAPDAAQAPQPSQDNARLADNLPLREDLTPAPVAAP